MKSAPEAIFPHSVCKSLAHSKSTYDANPFNTLHLKNDGSEISFRSDLPFGRYCEESTWAGYHLRKQLTSCIILIWLWKNIAWPTDTSSVPCPYSHFPDESEHQLPLRWEGTFALSSATCVGDGQSESQLVYSTSNGWFFVQLIMLNFKRIFA